MWVVVMAPAASRPVNGRSRHLFYRSINKFKKQLIQQEVEAADVSEPDIHLALATGDSDDGELLAHHIDDGGDLSNRIDDGEVAGSSIDEGVNSEAGSVDDGEVGEVDGAEDGSFDVSNNFTRTVDDPFLNQGNQGNFDQDNQGLDGDGNSSYNDSEGGGYLYFER
ncbi:Uncharacterized protein APZ42_014106 [Daphnia magna]|uniref:Uncharacterized protein n=1 Tax=Daphnia magna TaxID=35525 RepID=A0A162Q8G7_9CRUS|nr:Uncharacterized protein APZ42_014106 [Daphnia magna]